jgi:hypothetical protein
VSPEGITTNPEKLKAIQELLTPKNKRNKKLSGHMHLLQTQFIFGCANVAKPLTNLTEEKQAFQYVFPEVEVAFQTFKKALYTLYTAPILAYP